MKALSLVLSDQAEADLIDIWVYIAEDSAAAADAFATQLYEKCHLLAENPSLGRNRPEVADGLYSFPYKRYVIYYRQREHRLEVARVLSAYRDLDALF